MSSNELSMNNDGMQNVGLTFDHPDTPEQETLARLPCVRMQPGVAFSVEHPVEGWLSLAVGCDMRDECLVSLTDTDGKRLEIDAGYASHGQRLRVPWPSGCTSMRVEKVNGGAELWVLTGAPYAPCLVPKRVPIEARRVAAMERLRHDALCQFSWMGGCVLDGLWQLNAVDKHAGWDTSIRAFLDHYITGGELHYQSPHGAPLRNLFDNIEGTLPVAVIAGLDPQHPVCDMALQMYECLVREDGLIISGMVSAEGSYTVAYPLAVLARGRGDDALAELAFRQLDLRRKHLCVGDDIYLRWNFEQWSFRNWTRGICWYLLGLARSLSVLGVNQRPDLCEHFQERAKWVQSRQRTDGLWDNFLDEPGNPPDSSGSCGIAAALMTGASLGLLGDDARDSARRCWEATSTCLEPDGWLGSVAPNNKRGEVAQHGQRRTVEPFALGLYGQLAAAFIGKN